MTLKKAVSVILVFSIILCCSSVGFSANDSNEYCPVIIVPGYAGSALVKTNDDSTQEQVWGVDGDEILSIIMSKIVEIGIGFGALTVGNADYLADVVGKEAVKYLEDVRCNPDGSSKYNVTTKYKTAKETCRQALYEEYGNYEDYQFEKEFNAFFAEKIGNDKVFSFNHDFRNGAVKCAENLDAYIQEVKAETGCDKVNLYSISHGGQVTGTYLTLYGEKQDVNKAIMTVPALCGSSTLYDLFSKNVKFDELNLLYFIENGTINETDLHWLVEAQQLGFLDKVFNKLVPYLFDIAGYWGSVWDFMPTDIYEEMKSKWLDPVESAEIIKNSDYMHYEVMPQFYTSFQKCIDDYGMQVSIIAGVDINTTTGCPINSDGIIFTEGATGATCADYGKRFSDNYKQINPCGGKNKISPSMTIDASTSYLPDNTWFMSGMFHGMMVWEDFGKDLINKLMLTDEIKDVYSDPDFPQFHTSSNPSYSVFAKFDNSVEGFLSGDDTSLTVSNLTKEGNDLYILNVESKGIDLQFDLSNTGKPIKEDESINIGFSGDVSTASSRVIEIAITYAVKGTATPLGQRVLYFTVSDFDSAGGEASQFTEFKDNFNIFTSLITSFISRIVSLFRQIFRFL